MPRPRRRPIPWFSPPSAPWAGDQPLPAPPPPAPPQFGRLYGEADALFFWFKPVCASVPVLAIGNPQAAVPGALGQPGTQVVVGGSPPHKFEFPLTPGAQLTLGWDRGDGAVGLLARGFLMQEAANSQHFTADANGSPNTYLPYQAPDNSFHALPFTVPGLVTGGSVAVGSTTLWGVEGDLTVPFTLRPGPCTFYGSFLVGGRYLDLTDRVRITNALRRVSDPSSFAVGADQFSTHNQFAGPQIGTLLGASWQRCSLELTTRLAASVTNQDRNIDGSPLLNASSGFPPLVPGPLLVLPSNISHESARRVTLVPEIGLKTRFALTSWCSVSAGYSLLYWNKILCPGDQMSPLVNVSQLPLHGPVAGSLDPKPLFQHTDFFAQGFQFGLEIGF